MIGSGIVLKESILISYVTLDSIFSHAIVQNLTHELKFVHP